MAQARAFIAAHPKARQPWDAKPFRWPGGVRPDSPDARNLFAVAAGMLYHKTAGAYAAPEAILQVVQEGSLLSFDRALEVEARAFVQLAASAQAKDMIRTLWFHKRAADQHLGLPQVEAHGFARVGVLGAGMMGAGLAFICAKAGLNVVLRDLSDEALGRARAHCEAEAKKLRHLGAEERAELLRRIQTTTEAGPLRGVDLVIEAVFEQLELKHKVAAEVEPLLAPGAVYASNTSAIPITDLAQVSERPDAFIGLHFFSPVEKMPLLEIVRGAATSDHTVARCLAFARAIRKTPIVVNDGYGFYTTRVFSAYILEGAQLVAEGYHPDMVEWVAREQGMVVPPLQVFDEVSLELGVKAMTQAAHYLGSETDLAGKDLVFALATEHGRKGRAHGAGFYDYADGRRRGIWSGLASLVPHRHPVPADRQVIGRRLMLAQVAEVARALDSGIIDRNRDADVGAVFGIGFAPNTGGPLAFMDRQGLPSLVAELREAEARWGKRFSPSPVLVRMAKAGERFYPKD
jgi:3-hydroxyacyl-CoA dehydrogenase/enoyl-CoA hydratase/3-hydroxybutyryl-CoA epimerase